MIHFGKDNITLDGIIDPVEYWLGLHDGLMDLIRWMDQEKIDDSTFYRVADFVRDFMPDIVDAKKMNA
jgi:hypothetical protein